MSPFQIWVCEDFRDHFRDDSKVYLIESQVASMALTGETDDTLEVCLNNYEMTEEEEEVEDEEDVEEAVCHGCHPHKVYKPGRSVGVSAPLHAHRV